MSSNVPTHTGDKFAKAQRFVETWQVNLNHDSACPACGALPDSACVNVRTGDVITTPHPGRASNRARATRQQLDKAVALIEELSTTPATTVSLFGRERFMIEKLATYLHTTAKKYGDYTPIREIPRGNTFEVRLNDGRIAKVTIEFDRIEDSNA